MMRKVQMLPLSRWLPLAASAAQDKASRRRTIDQLPVQSFRDLLRHLATIVRNRIEPTLKSIAPFDTTTRPDPLQQRAFQLLQISSRLLAT
jgi:hypothetical protein